MANNPATPLLNSATRISRSIARVFQTSAFRLAGLYLLIFVLFAVFVLGYLDWTSRRLLERQMIETIETEIGSLADQYRQGGIRRLITVLERRGRQGGSFIYLLVDKEGDAETGNVILELSTLEQSLGWIEAEYNWPDESDEIERLAKIRVFILDSGYRLFVGRDLEERERLKDVIIRARGTTFLLVLVMGGFGGWFVTRRILKRIDAIARSSGEIMAGNERERLPLSSADDEFDRLAAHINLMLDRSEALMKGLRELSDNVAHDLRTPLTRLRNGIEDSLRTAKTFEESRAALEKAIENSEHLIRIFDALLMIARAESGNLGSTLETLSLDGMVEGIAELYEPLAEEAGLQLSCYAAHGLFVRANKELIGQAIANIIDNAIKYASPATNTSLTLTSQRVGDYVEITLADHGAGIPEAARQHVLGRFVRLEKSRAQPGFGLGLSLVAAIARLHGGELRLEDNAPGLRASLILPVALPAQG